MAISRRHILGASATLVGFGVAGAIFAPIHAAQTPVRPTVPFNPVRPDQTSAPDAPSKITVAGDQEPGERMIIAGRVTDGEKPIQGASVFVYHTDAEGIYGSRIDDSGDKARLKGFMRTDADGRYEFTTIRPGSYPGTRFPSHVHYAVAAPGYRDITPEFNFDDDPFMNDPGMREANAAIRRAIIKMTRDSDGVWHGVFDIVLTPVENAGL